MLPKTETGIKKKIQSYRSALQKEKRKFGAYHDGYGKRYLIFYLFYMLNDDSDAPKYFKWYEKNFSDDIGEPFQILCWALILKRLGKEKEARIKLAEHYKSNFYIIPKLIGKKVSKYKFWHSSNYEFLDYADEVPEEIQNKISQSEIEWLTSEYSSDEFNKLRIKYIDCYSKLENEKDVPTRRKLINEAKRLIKIIFE